MAVKWKLSFVAKTVGSTAPAVDAAVTGVSIDSRTILPGEVFVALRGESFDGLDFVAQAAARGAVAAVVERDVDAPLVLLRVRDSLEALRLLARARRNEFAGPVVAVTGSCGKTTTKDFISAVLATEYQVRSTAGNLNNQYGVPLSVLSLEPRDQALVLELGVSAPGDMAPVADAAAPTISVITNVAPTHLEFFGDVAAVRREKASLLDFMKSNGVVILNADDPLVASIANELVNGLKYLTFGLSEAADVYPRDYKLRGLEGARFALPGGTPVLLKVPGEFNVVNALAAAAVGRALGLGEERIAAGLGEYRGRALHAAAFKNGKGVTYIADCYNSSPLAAWAAINMLVSVPAAGRRIAVLGDMLELGETSVAAHRGVGKFAAESRVDVVIGVGAGGAEIVTGAVAAGLPAGNARAFASREELVEYLRIELKDGDVVLFKASRRVHLEDVLAGLGVALT